MSQPINRQTFIRDFFRLLDSHTQAHSRESNDPQIGKYILPPGAVKKDQFISVCEQSYDCVSACPHEAIRVNRQNPHDKLYSYPVIDPRIQACQMCEGFPCIEACHTTALTEESKNRPLGKTRINQQTCFAFHGIFCQACIMACPHTQKAIFLDEENHPAINDEFCTGCGICVQSCPTEYPSINVFAGN